MRIESSTVENHRFGFARRRGYDPAEVDSVMRRVADTLAQYERMIQRLESRIENTGVSQGDITRSVAAAQENKNQLISDAKTSAAQLVDAATEEAHAIRSEATLTADRIIGAADDHLAAAQIDAQRIRDEAASVLDVAHARSSELRAQAEEILTSAIADAEQLREQTERDAVSQGAEAEQILHLAQAEANRLTADTRHDSEQTRANVDAEVADVLADARRQAEELVNAAVEEARQLRDRLGADAEELRMSREMQADEIVSTARNEAAETRAAAAAAAEAISAQGRAEAEEALAEARNRALDRLTTARQEAEELLNRASHEADTILGAARDDTRRLERRVDELQAAIVEFEAHIANLAEVAGDRAELIREMISQEAASESRPIGAANMPGRQSRHPMDPSAPPAGPPRPPPLEGSMPYPEPDGSGQLPARRPVVPLVADPWGGDVDLRGELMRGDEVTPASEDGQEIEEPPQSADEASFTDDEAATDTIYQRRGGGIKRRVDALESKPADRSA